MYDRHLDTFIQVADCGSFLKASEKLYVSANAVTKQINLLENDLGIKLFQRSTQGLILTEAGKLIYTEAKKMIRHSRSVLQKAKELENQQEYVVRVGVSLMNPANILLEYWHKASTLYPNLRLEIVPFEDTIPAFNKVLNSLGEDIDLISCPYETNYWGGPLQLIPYVRPASPHRLFQNASSGKKGTADGHRPLWGNSDFRQETYYCLR